MIEDDRLDDAVRVIAAVLQPLDPDEAAHVVVRAVQRWSTQPQLGVGQYRAALTTLIRHAGEGIRSD